MVLSLLTLPIRAAYRKRRCGTEKVLEDYFRLVSCPPRARLSVRNGLVNEVKFLGLTLKWWKTNQIERSLIIT